MIANGNEPGLVYDLHAHAHNYPLETESLLFQTWDFINPRPETLLNGASLGAVRVQLASTGECINYIPTGGDFYLDSCVSGDKNEYFWLDATGGSSFGVPRYWLINVAASQYGAVGVGNYAYMTETGLGQPDSIWAEPPGWGIAAVWGVECQINC